MSYILDGSGVNSPECRRLEIQSVDRVERESGVPGTLLFDAVDAFIEHDGPEQNYKPYLAILGRPVGIQADMPYNVTTLRYQSSSDKKLMMYRYDFTRENLANMAMAGLFEEGFEPSHVARTSRYELPCEVSYVAFPPDDKLRDPDTNALMPPVVFASLQPGSLHCTDYESGYTIHDYFEAVPEQESEEDLQVSDYELPVAARVLGNEFSFDSDVHVQPVVEDVFQAAPEVPNLDDLSESGPDSKVEPGALEMAVSEPSEPNFVQAVSTRVQHGAVIQREAPVAHKKPAKSHTHDVSDMNVSRGSTRRDIESEFI